MKEHILNGLWILNKIIAHISLKLTAKMIKYIGIVVIEEKDVYGDNP